MAETISIYQPGERAGVILRGATLAACAAAQKLDVDFAWFRRRLSRQTKIAGLSFFPAAPEDPDVSGTSDWSGAAKRAGFRVVEPPESWSGKYTHCEWTKRQLAETAVEIFVSSQNLDHILLCAGDAALTPLVRLVQRNGVRVTVISSIRNRPRLISDELRRQADHFIEFAEMHEMFVRPTN